jgi:3',5'-cyclic AMP phosphodiesterase CpdA
MWFRRPFQLRLLPLLVILAMAGCGEKTPPPAPDAAPDDAPRIDSTQAEDAAPSDTAAPDSSGPDASGQTRPIWFLHLSDPHLGAQSFGTAALTAAIQEVVPAVAAASTLLTGDIADSGKTEEWSTYQTIITSQVPAFPTYLEVIGNHDVKADNGPSFLANTRTGKAGGGLYGLSYIDTPQGRVRVVHTNTVNSSSALNQLLGYLGETQLKELQALPPSPVPPTHSIVAGHHPLKGVQSLQVLGTDARMRQLFDHFSAELYLCGHAHFAQLSWEKSTLVVQAPTLGKPEIVTPNPGLAIISLDVTGPSARVFNLNKSSPVTVSWPLVLITTPADVDLGGTNPHAKPVSPGATLTVRVLAFSVTGVQSTEARLGGDSWTAMTAVDSWLWQAELTAPSTAGRHTLEVLALSAEGTATHEIDIVVGP